jgi:signal transduction histidine kinase
MLSDLLDLDRLRRNDLQPNRQPTDLRELAEGVVGETSHGRHTVLVEGDRLVASVDAAKVERIVVNLVGNATKYSPAGSTVTLRIGPAAGGVELSVRDEGPGVPGELKVEVFEPFRQADPSSSGAGIGLSLVSKFAELHGGRAWVEDGPARGAVFRVFLPAAVELQVVDGPVTEPV